ncbi:MAG: tandem-95 repeat protein, partial [Verrucomicrobiae bacterium]|nr:tandem-95 repeat protein [Verrucomicrobiae bacterium]
MTTPPNPEANPALPRSPHSVSQPTPAAASARVDLRTFGAASPEGCPRGWWQPGGLRWVWSLLLVGVWILGVAPLQAAVTIVTQPQSTAALVGDKVTLQLWAAGTGTLSYQWMKNGAPLVGQTAATLVLDPVAFTDAGQYTVEVSDETSDTVTSAVAGLGVHSAPGGEVDLSFLAGSAINGSVNAVAVQSDGKVLIGGAFTTVNGVVRGRIARLNADGTTDETFGNGLAGANDNVGALAVQGDGKVLIGGNFTAVNGATRGRVARLNSDGTLDTSFGNGMSGANSAVLALAVQGDGRVLMGGDFTTVNGSARGRVTRLNSNGTLDTSFGNGLAGANSVVHALAVQGDGKVLMGGRFTTVNGAARARVARLNSNGTLDTGFGNALNLSGGNVYALALQSDGKVFIGGDFPWVNGIGPGELVRLNTDGTQDTSFREGWQGLSGGVVALAVQNDGKVLIGGWFTQVNGVGRGKVARLNSDGTLDTSFGNGQLGTDHEVRALALQGDGKVLIGGDFKAVNGVARGGAARLNSNGTLDTGFGNGMSGPHSGVEALAVQSDGKVLIGGSFAAVSGVARGRVARLNSDGTLDTSFGNGLTGANEPVWALALQGDGKVLIGGGFSTVNGVARGRVARLNSNGTLDTSFGSGQAGANEQVWALVLQSNGKVLIGGSFTAVNGVARGRVARLNSDGTLDTSFGNGLTGASWTVRALALQGDGKVLIGGEFNAVNGVARSGVARLNSDGTLDTSFWNGSAGANSTVQALTVQGDGKALIGGSFSTVNGVARGGVARLNSNGTLDTGFGDGLVGANGTVQAVAIQSNGKVLIGGDFNGVNGVARGRVARLNTDGTLDTSFGNGLSGASNSRLGSGIVRALKVQSDGKVLMGGEFDLVNGRVRNYVDRLHFSKVDVDLTSLTLSSGTLSPAFNGGHVAYEATFSANSLTVTPVSRDSAAAIHVRINGGSYALVPSGSPSAPLTLGPGVNLVDVRLTSADTSVVKVYTLKVTNPGPSAIHLSHQTVPENEPVGTVVGLLTAEDPDPDDIHTFELVAGERDTDNALFSIVGRELRTAAVFDYEAPREGSFNTYTVRVRATDPGGLSVEDWFTIDIQDVNEPPVAFSQSVTTPEDAPVAITLTGEDPDLNPLLFEVISSPGQGVLQEVDGTFLYTPKLNYFGLDSFTFVASDGEFVSEPATVSITVTPVNDAPYVVQPIGSIVVDENAAPTQIDLRQVFADVETPASALAYAVTVNSNPGVVTATVNGVTGTLTLSYAPDRSGRAILFVRATDPGGLYAEDAVRVTVARTSELSPDEGGLAETHAFGDPFTGAAEARARLLEASDGTLYGTSRRGGPANAGTVFRLNKDGSGFAVLKAFVPADDGGEPHAGLIEGGDGLLYGTTHEGGQWGYGAVFRLGRDGTGFEVLRHFAGADGRHPKGDLIEGSDGWLYGTTSGGGASGGGTVFRLGRDGAGHVILKHLAAADGTVPYAGLMEGSDGLLYGTTHQGGTAGFGTVFRLGRDGSAFQVIQSFAGPDGRHPRGGVYEGSDGALYGTTYQGGSLGWGTVFRIEKSGSGFAVRHHFNGSQGRNPHAGVIEATDGFLYGTTESGTGGTGAVFKVRPDGTGFVLVRQFTGEDGRNPLAALIEGSDGALYGTTSEGGMSGSGSGAIFRVQKDGGSFAEIHRLNPAADGAYPFGGVVEGSDGFLYGTTDGGGDLGVGTVFRVRKDGTGLVRLKSFGFSGDGRHPGGGVIEGNDALLYGTTLDGGSFSRGTVFRLNRDGSGYQILQSMGGTKGSYPGAGLLQARDGALYGTAMEGGTADRGTVFRLDPDGAGFAVLVNFTGANGAHPVAPLIEGHDGALYGTTSQGGVSDAGTAFRVNRDGSGFLILKQFSWNEGASPQGRLTQASDGLLYGTTTSSGGGGGTVFRMSPDGSVFEVLKNLAEPDGRLPLAGLAEWNDGALYGTTFGEADGRGTVFRLRKDGSQFQVLAVVGVESGDYRRLHGQPTFGTDSRLYLTATEGGPMNLGGVLSLGVGPYNGGPAAIHLSNQTVPENEPVGTLVGLLTAEDPDADDTHVFALVAGEGDTDNAMFSIVGNELRTAVVFDYEAPREGSFNTYTVRIRATYAGGLFVEDWIPIDILDVNEAPVAYAQSVTTAEDTPVAITLTGEDPDLNVLLFHVISGPSHGVVVEGYGDFIYTPNPNYHGPDSFAFVANDGEFLSEPATVSITVMPVNDAPYVVQPIGSIVVNENAAPTQIALQQVFADVETPASDLAYTIRANSNPALVQPTLSSLTGILTLSVPANRYGEAVIVVRCTDPGGLYAEDTITLVIQQVRERVPGDVDLGFEPLAGLNGAVHAVVVRPDGRLLIGGSFSSVRGSDRMRIARLHPDGSVDHSFDPGTGIDPSQPNSMVSSIAVQDDGGILVGGIFSTVNGVNRTGLVRLRADGSVDQTFNGQVVGSVFSVALQDDGRMLIGGQILSVGGVNRNGIARLNADGSLDSSFDPGLGVSGGMVFTVLPLPDGRVLVGGSFSAFNGVNHPGVVWLNPDGSLNPSTPVVANGSVHSMARQADGRILMGGSFNSVNGAIQRAIARLEPNGALDQTFAPTVTGTVASLAALPGGRVGLGGTFGSVNGVTRQNIAMLRADGSLESSFQPQGGANAQVLVIAQAPGDELVVGGHFIQFGGQTTPYLARVGATGKAASGFDAGSGIDRLVRVVLGQEDGKVLVGGSFTVAGRSPIRKLVRLNE